MYRKRILSLLICFVLLFTSFSYVAFAEERENPFSDTENQEFLDMPNDWSKEALENAVNNGLLKGDDGMIMSKDNLTRAQMATIVNRAFGTTEKASLSNYTDVSANAWYYDEMAKAVQMKTFIGSGAKLNPDSNITREEAFVVLARAFKLSGSTNNSALDKFSDKDLVSTWAKDGAASLVTAGYVEGSNNQLNPKQNITRAEFAQLMDNLLKNYIKESGTYTTDINGNVMINVPNVMLKDMTITGDLVMGDGVGNGDVTLDNVVVTGRTVIRGGGVNSIKIIGNSSIQNIVIARVDGQVRVYTEDGTEIGDVEVDGNDNVIIEGDMGNITVIAPDITVTAANAKIASGIVEGENSKIIVSVNSTIHTAEIKGDNAEIIVLEGSTIESIIVNGIGADISGEGNIGEVEANADDITISTRGTEVTAGEGTTGIIAGTIPVTAGNTEIIPGGNTDGGRHSHSSSGSSSVAIREITVTSEGNATTVANGEGLQMSAAVIPVDATNQTITWSVAPLVGGTATIDSITGLLTATGVGTVTVIATNGASGITGMKDITVTNGSESATLPLVFYTPVTLTQTGDVANNNVQYGDAEAVIAALPTEIEVTLENASVVNVPVTWTDTETYDAGTAGDYTFTATWGDMPTGANNDNSLEAPTVEVTVSAGGEVATPENYFNIDGETGTIVYYDIAGGSDVVIPSTIYGVEVKGIGDCVFSNKSVIKVYIPYGVESIGTGAFQNCPLTRIDIPDSVTTIGESAFDGCTELTRIDIPDSVTTIGVSAFQGCEKLTTIKIPDSVTTICTSAFEGCKELTTIDISDNVTSSGDLIFSDCYEITSITLGNNVSLLGDYSFEDSNKLTSITIGNNVSFGTAPFVAYNEFDIAYTSGGAGTYTLSGDTWTKLGESATSSLASFTPVTLTQTGDTTNRNVQYEDGLEVIAALPTEIAVTLEDGSVVNVPITWADTDNYYDGTAADYTFTAIWGEMPVGVDNDDGLVVPSVEVTVAERPFFFTSSTGTIRGYLIALGGNDPVIPTTIDGVTVKSIGDTVFQLQSTLNSVTIPDSVTSIGSNVFECCSKLTSVIIPDSVISLGNAAFKDCSKLTNVTISNKLESIGSHTFFNCSELTSVTIPGTVINIGTWAFKGCSGLTSLTILDGVESIEDYAFQGCSELISVTIPNSVESIGNYGFEGCSGLTSITISDSVKSIGGLAFSGCDALTSVTILNSTTSMGINPFEFNNSFQTAYTAGGAGTYTLSGDTWTKFDESATSCLESFTPVTFTQTGDIANNNVQYGDAEAVIAALPTEIAVTLEDSSVVNVPITWADTDTYSTTTAIDYTFTATWGEMPAGANNDNNLAVPTVEVTVAAETVTPEEYFTFESGAITGYNIAGGLDVVIPTTIGGVAVTSLADDALLGKSTLTSVTIPDSVESIGAMAFWNCTGLTSVTIPDSVTSIGNYVFLDCRGLTSVTIGNSMTSIGDGVFSGCRGLTSVTIPDSVTSIGNSAFNGCSGLTSVTISDSVTSIGIAAFSGCDALTSVTIGNSVSIGDSAFINHVLTTSFQAAYTAGGAGTYTLSGDTWTK